MLSVADYNLRDRIARIQAPISAVQAFTPLSFSQDGYPTDIGHEREILKYTDGVRPTTDALYWKGEEFSACERELIHRVREAVARISERTSGRIVRPYFIFPGMIQPFRLITRLRDALWQGDAAGPVVWEIGCGSAFLGALLLAAGVKYWGFDVTPSMYLWQSRLWTEIVGVANIDEQAELPLDRDATYSSAVQSIHIPWWRYIRDFSASAPKADIVVCDGALTELTDVALAHILRTAARAVSESCIGAFVCTTFGAPRQRSQDALINSFYQAGFALAWFSNCWVAVHKNSPFFSESYTIDEVRGSLARNIMYVDAKRGDRIRKAASNLLPPGPEGDRRSMSQAFPLGEDVSDEILFGSHAGLYRPIDIPYGRSAWISEAEFEFE